MIRCLLILLLTIASMPTFASGPKHEFRGAWLSTVFQPGYARRSTAENRQYLRKQLDELQRIGINAVIFQVRPSADAFYPSEIEPWSRFLTGTAGKAPSPIWDPLQFMIDECHARGMELHAWLNPYRITTSAHEQLPAGHIALKYPGRTITYAGKRYFNPGLPENRRHILRVIKDIITRYDIDGVHFDDYFYPYPVRGVKFNDNAAYAKYGKGMKLADWRRANVDSLISDVHKLISTTKPWVRFGISPFGIWRNNTSHPSGSATAGLQNYDDLYADVILWTRNGWIDYLMPQLYWEYNHPKASYATLIDWWDNQASDRHLYIGQDVKRTATGKELGIKMNLLRTRPHIQGACWWPGYELTDSRNQALADTLRSRHHSSMALVPSYPWLNEDAPAAPESLLFDSNRLRWSSPEPAGESSDIVKWAVYRFDDPETIDTSDSSALVALTWTPEFIPATEGIYTVTAISRTNMESSPAIPIMVIF